MAYSLVYGNSQTARRSTSRYSSTLRQSAPKTPSRSPPRPHYLTPKKIYASGSQPYTIFLPPRPSNSRLLPLYNTSTPPARRTAVAKPEPNLHHLLPFSLALPVSSSLSAFRTPRTFALSISPRCFLLSRRRRPITRAVSDPPLRSRRIQIQEHLLPPLLPSKRAPQSPLLSPRTFPSASLSRPLVVVVVVFVALLLVVPSGTRAISAPSSCRCLLESNSERSRRRIPARLMWSLLREKKKKKKTLFLSRHHHRRFVQTTKPSSKSSFFSRGRRGRAPRTGTEARP